MAELINFEPVELSINNLIGLEQYLNIIKENRYDDITKIMIDSYKPENKLFYNDLFKNLPIHIQTLEVNNIDYLFSDELPNTLKTISIKKTKLDKIPEHFIKLINLEDLKIEDGYISKIEDLPPNIINLDLSYNQIYNVDYSNLPQTLLSVKLNYNFLSVHPPIEIRTKIDYRQNNINDKEINLIILNDNTNNFVRNHYVIDNNAINNNNNNAINNNNRVLTSNTQHVLNNSQSVHLSSINKTIDKSIKIILERTKDIPKDNNFMDDLKYFIYGNWFYRNLFYLASIKYLELSIKDKNVHSVHNITYVQLLERIWQIIKVHEKKNELKERFKVEISDSIGYCFTGRLNRLVNILSGYIDELNVSISDDELVQGKILVLIKKLNEGKINKEEVKNEFKSIFEEYNKYDETKKQSWFDALDDY